jgi:hypothetical protein
MDPNANMAEQERIIRRRGIRASHPGDMARMRELRAALLGWLRAGGFQPDWARYPNASEYYYWRGEAIRLCASK